MLARETGRGRTPLAVLALAALLGAPLAAALCDEAALSFTDITIAAGCGGPTERGRTGGHGAMFADADRDGLPDLYVTMIFDSRMPDLFFRNLGRGRFADEGERRGIADLDGGSHGACWADLDNDGDFDLANGTTWPDDDFPNFNNLFRNDGAGVFEDVTPDALKQTRLVTRALLCFDMDADGDLDLFAVTNYRGSDDPAGERNEVYRNDGGFRFTAVDAGDLATCPAGQGAIDTDFDGDGDVDVIAANRTGEVNILRSDGAGTFERVAPVSLGIRHRAADGITTADVDNDGDLDLLLAGGDDAAALYTNDGGGRFSFRQSFADFDGYMGGFADLDSDGDLDLVFAGDGRVFLNVSGTFTAGPAVPVDGIDDPRGIAFSDVDNDGDADFAIGAKRSRNWLVRNDSGGGSRWLKVGLVSPAGQAGAFGAKVSLFAASADGDGALLGFREARSNAGYLGQDDPVLHFGVAGREHVDVEVVFLGGARVRHRSVATNQTVVVDGVAPFLADRIGAQWRPVLEWRIEASGGVGRAVDVAATATFRHSESGEERTTPMFRDADGSWRFRFTGTRPGVWSFTTKSDRKALDGREGTVTITPSADPGAHGFLAGLGDMWGWQGTERAFVPQLVMYDGDARTLGQPARIDDAIETFFVEHGFNGFHVPSLGGQWFDYASGNVRVEASMTEPDPATFVALERLITRTHAAGGMVHIWAWGDHQRRQTSLSLEGGPHGAVARRLERTIAARLGPLPGWSMGYGFDLQEWAAVPGRVDLVRPWAERLGSLMGWPHMLGGRMGPTIKGGDTDHRAHAELNAGLGYASYEHHRPTYAMYRAALAALPGRPVMSEDRFRIRVPPLYPDKDYDEELTRRGLYHSTMAGGVANIWGNNHPGGWTEGGGSRSYAHPELIRTWATFFEDRFARDMAPLDGVSNGVSENVSDGVCLASADRTRFVFYREDASSIALDLSSMSRPRPAVAVDTKRVYEELPIGRLEPGARTWEAPRRSDWILAVGEFERERRP